MSSDDWDRLAVGTALLVLFAAWTVFPRLILGAGLWYVGVIWAAVYVLFHIIEIGLKGHCYLSADSTAAPAVIETALLLAVVLSVFGVTTVTANGFAYVRAFVVSFLLGHVLSLLYAAALNGFGRVVDGILLRVDARRKDRPPQHKGLAQLSRTEKEVKKRKETHIGIGIIGVWRPVPVFGQPD